MKRIIIFIACFAGVIGILYATIFAVNRYYDYKLNKLYADSIGNNYGDAIKDQGLAINKISADKKDNLLIFGSSELGARLEKYHPTYMFENKKTGFQVNIIGRGYTQSITHAIDFAALGSNLKNKKVVFIISPQWFEASGITSSDFAMNFSELQFYGMLFNNDVDANLKNQVFLRVKTLLKKTDDRSDIKMACSLYTENTFWSKTIYALLKPYFGIKYYYLELKDKINACKELEHYNEAGNSEPQSNNINWDEEKLQAEKDGKEQADNNSFAIENNYYNMYIKNNLTKYKNMNKNNSYVKSPEYDDLKMLLSICKEEKIKPLFISVPVHGKWYDYTGFSKEDRSEYYNKVNNLITSNGFEIADFSNMEYEDYFLKDVMHLGWKGWVYVDEAIDKYYKEN